MPLFPSLPLLTSTFPSGLTPSTNQKQHLTPEQVSARYPFASVSDKANQLSKEAEKELEKAQRKIQQKTGGIELYSPKYYVACTIGGLAACVSLLRSELDRGKMMEHSADGRIA